MLFTQWYKDRFEELRNDVRDIKDLIRWGEVSDNKDKKSFFNHIRSIAITESQEQIKELEKTLGCEVSREEFDLLLDHLKLEIRDGKRIVKKNTSK